MRRVLLAIATISLSGLLTNAWADEAAVDAEARCILSQSEETGEGACISKDDLLGMLDLTVPENVLFSLMNSTPETVIRPKVGDSLMVSFLPQLQNALGAEDYAFGFEVNPGLMMAPERFTVAELMGSESAWSGSSDRRRALRDSANWSRFTIAGAASRQSADDATVTRYGIGINFNHDEGSPLWARAQARYGDCIREQFTLNPADERNRALGIASDEIARARLGIASNVALDNPNITDEQRREYDSTRAALRNDPALNERVNELLDDDPRFDIYQQEALTTLDHCVETAAPWNRRVYGAGIAAFYTETETSNGATAPEEEVGYGFWASYATPLGESDRRNQVIASVRYVDNGIRTRTEAGNEVTEAYDSWTVGARYVRSFAEGDNSRRAFRGFVEAAYTQEEFGGVDDEFSQAGIGFEVQLRDNIFFQAMVGDTFGSDIERGSYLTGQIKWSFSEGPAR